MQVSSNMPGSSRTREFQTRNTVAPKTFQSNHPLVIANNRVAAKYNRLIIKRISQINDPEYFKAVSGSELCKETLLSLREILTCPLEKKVLEKKIDGTIFEYIDNALSADPPTEIIPINTEDIQMDFEIIALHKELRQALNQEHIVNTDVVEENTKIVERILLEFMAREEEDSNNSKLLNLWLQEIKTDHRPYVASSNLSGVDYKI